jgi:hypothetical protein
MTQNKTLLTVVVVLALAFGLGAFFLIFNDQGVPAEIVEVHVEPTSPRRASVMMCAPAGGHLGGEGGPDRAVVQVSETTELIDQRKRSPANVRPADLAPGQRVRLWTQGAMLLTDPPQLIATRISLLGDPVPGQSQCAP